MAAKEDLYAKVTPRRQRQSRPSTVKHGSTLDVLLSMGFPKTRALKALVSTGGKNVQAACDWLFSHLDDPFLDDPLPREYVLYLRPSGQLLQQLSHFWQQSRLSCGKNKAHNIFPHITLCQFFMCADGKVEALSDALQTTVAKWKGRIPLPLPLELYTSTTFIGLFVEEQVAEVLKSFAADFATEAAAKADVHVEPHKKQLHVTLAYHFQVSHLPVLEKLAKNVDTASGCDWLAVLFSRDIRFANHETLQVMYPYVPQNDDELELVTGDFIFMSPVEQSSASEGWVYGTSLGTGLSGLLPENYVNRADESDTWVVHGSHSVLNCRDLPHSFSLCFTLSGLQQEGKTKIRVEPGLFEWTKWVSGTCLPTWIPPADLAAANLSVDTTYRPHIPISKLAVSESYDTYISRSFQVTQEILAGCKSLGNTVLIVAHASSLEACTRQIQGLSPQNSKDFVQVVRKIPYLGFCACEEMGETGVWQLVDPPILPLTHGPNHSFNWREMLMQD
ncbi:ubiquitin-associated and SH3 domain-containing protein B-like [Seriola lalandi dorsalis]|uniref:ubiquitin-associated and SH3 domain-containing protein B-like n=1 Tax=Seriola lalandi dorsalis TaxID=1841481 RepID=UPI000C6F6EED|nr:ubiquitin-associated and SH3 domain-containing protein B-like [Seriola lalandi dorsalis]